MEESAKSMGQRSNYAAVSDALSMPRKEECASIRHGAKLKVKLCSSEGCLNLAGAGRGVSIAVKDAQIELSVALYLKSYNRLDCIYNVSLLP
jgi:hypothetical protein